MNTPFRKHSVRKSNCEQFVSERLSEIVVIYFIDSITPNNFGGDRAILLVLSAILPFCSMLPGIDSCVGHRSLHQTISEAWFPAGMRKVHAIISQRRSSWALRPDLGRHFFRFCSLDLFSAIFVWYLIFLSLLNVAIFKLFVSLLALEYVPPFERKRVWTCAPRDVVCIRVLRQLAQCQPQVEGLNSST